MIFEPNLWHFNRHSVSFAFFIGVFCCFLPIPFQMIPCVILAVWLRCNVPLSIALVWISNPVTMGPMFYSTYKLGTFVLGERNEVSRIVLSGEWLSAQFSVVWQPLLLGSLMTGLVLGSLAFIVVRLYWRWKVARHISLRKKRRLIREALAIRSAALQQDEAAKLDKPDTKSPQG